MTNIHFLAGILMFWGRMSVNLVMQRGRTDFGTGSRVEDGVGAFIHRLLNLS